MPKEVKAGDTRKKMTDGDGHLRRNEETDSKSHTDLFVNCLKLLNVQFVLHFLMFNSLLTFYLALSFNYYVNYHLCHSSQYFCRTAT